MIPLSFSLIPQTNWTLADSHIKWQVEAAFTSRWSTLQCRCKARAIHQGPSWARHHRQRQDKKANSGMDFRRVWNMAMHACECNWRTCVYTYTMQQTFFLRAVLELQNECFFSSFNFEAFDRRSSQSSLSQAYMHTDIVGERLGWRGGFSSFSGGYSSYYRQFLPCLVLKGFLTRRTSSCRWKKNASFCLFYPGKFRWWFLRILPALSLRFWCRESTDLS